MSDSPYRTPEEVASYYRVPLKTVRYWRELGIGPIPIKVGKYLRYPVSEIERYDTELREKAKEKAS